MNFPIEHFYDREDILQKPKELDDLLYKICREVLRCQPIDECIYKFIADYLESLERQRDNAEAITEVINRTVDRLKEITEFMHQCLVPCDKVIQMGQQMEKLFRKFIMDHRCMRNGFDEEYLPEFICDDDLVEKMMAECNFTIKQLSRSRCYIKSGYKWFAKAYNDAIEGTRCTDALYEYYKGKDEAIKEKARRNKAALQIQTMFRGYLVRRIYNIKRIMTKKPIADCSCCDQLCEDIRVTYGSNIVLEQVEKKLAEDCKGTWDDPSIQHGKPI